MERVIRSMVLMMTVSILGGCGQQATTEAKKEPKRIGMVIGIKPDQIEEYKKIHADSYPGVRDLLNKYNIHDLSIFLQEIEGKFYEFGYYEYTGDDFDGDMGKLAAEPRNIEWLKICDPMQIPLPGSESWTEMEQVYFNQ